MFIVYIKLIDQYDKIYKVLHWIGPAVWFIATVVIPDNLRHKSEHDKALDARSMTGGLLAGMKIKNETVGEGGQMKSSGV